MVGSGSITGLPDTDKAYFDFDIKELVSARTSMTFCPKKLSLIPLTCLHRLMLGTFKGTINNFSTDLILESSLVLQN
jgi:hypothetical protein